MALLLHVSAYLGHIQGSGSQSEEYMAQHKKGDAGVPDGTVNCTVYTKSHTS